jgi:copper chaperone CopZ
VTSSGFSDLVLNFRLFANLVQLFYGDREPTWIVGNYPHEEIQAPYTRHMVPSIELMVPMCCNICEGKLRRQLCSLEGVDGVICDQWNQKVTVTGNVDPAKVLKRVRQVKKKAQFWARKVQEGQMQGYSYR